MELMERLNALSKAQRVPGSSRSTRLKRVASAARAKHAASVRCYFAARLSPLPISALCPLLLNHEAPALMVEVLHDDTEALVLLRQMFNSDQCTLQSPKILSDQIGHGNFDLSRFELLERARKASLLLQLSTLLMRLIELYISRAAGPDLRAARRVPEREHPMEPPLTDWVS